MAKQDALAQLKDIHLPESIGLWPPAIGWWLLALITVMVIIITGFSLWRWYQRGRFRRQALAELLRLESEYQHKKDAQRFLAALSQLLRRYVLAVHGRSKTAGLSGEQWLDFLGEDFMPFKQQLLEAPYQPQSQYNPMELAVVIKRWLKKRRVADV